MNISALRNSAFQDEVPNYVHTERTIYTFNAHTPRASRVRVVSPRSDWFESLKGRFDELATLPVGWDGYKGIAVKFTCAQFAANLIERLCDPSLPPPCLVPGGDGTVQIEWHRNQYDIEIDVLAPFQVVASRFDNTTGQGEEIELDSDFSELASWIADLKIDRQLAEVMQR